MGMYGERMGRGVTREEASAYAASVEERARRQRWSAGGTARVIHPLHGTVVVPTSSKLTAIMNAAEVWGCKWADILDAEVWRAEPEEKPIPMPYII